MKKNHFVFGYFGNKRQEVEKLYDVIKDDIGKFKIIVEPFCGTAAFSYYVWFNNQDMKTKYILNDNNKMLYDLYNILKDDTKRLELYNKLCIMLENVKNKEDYTQIVKKSDEDIVSYCFVNKIYSIRPALYPSNKNFTIETIKSFINAPIIQFLKNADIEFRNDDAIKVYDEYKSNKHALLFLDPPYLISNNSWYKCPCIGIYEYLMENIITKEKATILLCLESNWIIKLLFKNLKSIIYDKTYETTKKKTEHIIIINKKV